ncbi:MAG: hypothetical protein K8T10_21390 [Candidatus Eremiobacteraeota bacterium]|nr:hypothetical protein [Candidatus Eremiobacteraeota bacterium]
MNTINAGMKNETGAAYKAKTVENKTETNVPTKGDSVKLGQGGENEIETLKREIAELKSQMGKSNLLSTSGDYLARGKEYAKTAGQTVREGAQSASDKCEEFVTENPKMTTLITAGAGILAGIAIEKTDVMGKVNDKVAGTVRNSKREIKNFPKKHPVVSTIVKEGLRLGTTAVVVDAVVKRRMEKMKVA